MTSKGSILPKRIERVQNAVQQLPSVAADINAASDQLSKSINELDTLLKKFSLGVPTWVSFVSSEYNHQHYEEDIGYAKLGGKWGIAIRTVDGNYQYPDADQIEQWLFNEAPRLLRVRAVEMIPELLEELLKKTAEMTKEITDKAQEVDALTAGIKAVLHEVPQNHQTNERRRGETARK